MPPTFCSSTRGVNVNNDHHNGHGDNMKYKPQWDSLHIVISTPIHALCKHHFWSATAKVQNEYQGQPGNIVTENDHQNGVYRECICQYIRCNENNPPVLDCVPNVVDVAGLNPNAVLAVGAAAVWPNSEGVLPRPAPNPPTVPNPVVPLVAPNAGVVDVPPNPEHHKMKPNCHTVVFITSNLPQVNWGNVLTHVCLSIC